MFDFRKGFVLSGLRISAVVCLYVIAMIAAFNLSGCGGSSSSSSSSSASPSVTVTATLTTVDGSGGASGSGLAQTSTLTASVTNDKSTNGTTDGVTWTVSGAPSSSLSNTSTTGATFTAPAATSTAQTVTITATSVADTSKTATATITIPALIASSTTTAQLTTTVGTVYSQQLTVSGGNGTNTWTTTPVSGSLPAGWTLTSGGLLSGPALINGQAGAYTFTVAVKDSGTYSATLSLTVTINQAPAITFTGAMPLTGTYGTSYSGTSTATGGAGALTYTLASGSLPTGVTPTVAGNYSAISGTPTAVGPFNFTIKAADSFGDSNTQAYTVTIGQETPTLVFATIATQPYSATTVTATASDTGTAVSNGAITYSVTSGPASINSSTGVVTLTGAGTVNLKATQASSTDFAAPTPATTSFVVNKAAATINVTPYTVTYDGNSHTAGVTATGVGGVNLAADVTLNTTHTSAGSYTSDTWSFTDPNGNYNPVAATTITDTINQANATISVTPYSVAYDGNPHTALGTATGVGGSNLIADLNLTGTTHTNAGSYTTDSWSFTDSNGNYASKTGTVTDVISGASATVNLINLSQNYTGSQISASATTVPTGQTVTFTYTGIGTTVYATSATPPANAGSYTVVGTISNANYAGSSTGTLVISPVAATINVTPYTVTYDGKAHTAGVIATGVGGVNLAGDVTLNTTHTNAGSYTTDTWSFTDPSGNYLPVTATTITDTINQVTPTLSFTSIATQTYSSAGQTVTAVASSASSGAITSSVTSGPATINSSTGVVTLTGSGTVNLKATQAATTNYAAPAPATTSFLVNTAALVLTPSLPTAVQNQNYTGSVTASGGVGPYTWTVNGTPLAAGNTASLGNGTMVASYVSGSTATLNISGTPATTASVTVNVSIVDGQSTPATQSSSNTITVTAFGISTTSLAAAYTGTAYSQPLTVVGGSVADTYQWTVSINNTGFTGLGLSINSSNGTISGTAAGLVAGSATFTVKVVDTTINATTTQQYTLNVYSPLSLTAPSSTVPGSAIISTAYTGSTIYASGGSSNYSWSVTGLGSGMSYNNPTGSSLVISGTAPSTSETISFNVTLTDTSTGKTYGPITYSILVAPATPLTLQTGGTLTAATINSLYNGGINSSGGSGSGYIFSINGTPVPTDGTQVLISDNIYVFYNGGSSLNISGTPTQAGTVTLTNVSVTDSAGDNAGPVTYTITVNPVVPTGYTVSGTVSYAGSHGGWVYLELIPNNGCSGCNQNLGTAINAINAGSLASGMAYTIHGVPAGTYTLKAYMDGIGFGLENASDPTGSLSNLNVTSSGLSNQNFTLTDPATVSLGTYTPTWDPSSGYGAFNGGAVVSFDPICNGSGCNNGGVEMPTSYYLIYSTDSTFNSGVTRKCFLAQGGNSPWVVSGLTNGLTYYFRAAGYVGATGTCTNSPGALTYSAAAPSSGLVINAPSVGSLLSGTVTFTSPVSATGKTLYAGCYDSNTGKIYADPITSPVSPQAYSVYVPNGTACQIFGFIDLNNTGLIGGAGELSNTSGNIGMIAVTVNAPTSGQNFTLPSGNSVAVVKTQSYSSSGGTNYNVGFQVNGGYKLPVAVELLSETPNVSGTVADVVLPADIATDAFNNYNDEFDYWPQVTGTPVAGDSYSFKVTYSDGTSETLSAAVTGVLSAFATNLSPTGTGVSTTPNFSWDYPSSASSYLYQFQLNVNNGNTVWKIPADHSNSNGFASSISPFITWDVDPTNTGDLPSSSYLTSGGLSASTTYNWSISAYDANMNEAKTSVSFTTTAASLTLSANNKGFGPALAGSPFTGQITASGGSGSYPTWTVNSTPITAASLGAAMTFSNNDGLEADVSGSMLYIVGTPTSAESSLSLSVSVTDSATATVTQTFNLVVSGGPGPSGTRSSLLNGTYVCKFDGFFDGDGSRWSSLSSFVANGSGSISSGVWDMNSRDFSAPYSGTISGTYSVGADNMGVMTTNSVQTSGGTGTHTNTYAIAVNDANGATSRATEFRLVEIDDVGTSPAGMHGSGVCYQAPTSAFVPGTLSGNSFAYGVQGESGSGVPHAYVGRYSAGTESTTGGTGGTAGGSITNGISDGMKLSNTSDDGSSFTGSYTAPNTTTGRYTMAILFGGSIAENYVGYIIDASRGFLLETDPGSTYGIQSGDVRKQQQSANTAAILLSGSSVLYAQGFDGNSSGSVTGYESMVLQTSDASTSTYAGTLTVNASFEDSNGTYKSGNENGQSPTVTLDSANPGRATFSQGSDSGFFYFYNTGSAFYLDLNGSNHYLETGWLESQTQPSSLPFANANIAGSYVSGQLPRLNSGDNDNITEGTLNSSGGMTGSNTLANAGSLQWDQPVSAMGAMGYSWLSQTYGAFSETLNGTAFSSCIVITPVQSGTAGKVVCIENTSSGTNVSISEQ